MLADKTPADTARDLAMRAKELAARIDSGGNMDKATIVSMLNEGSTRLRALATHYDTLRAGVADLRGGRKGGTLALFRKDAPEQDKEKYVQADKEAAAYDLGMDEIILLLCGLHFIQHMYPDFFHRAQDLRGKLGDGIPDEGYTGVDTDLFQFAGMVLECDTLEKFITMQAMARVLGHGMETEGGDEETPVEA